MKKLLIAALLCVFAAPAYAQRRCPENDTWRTLSPEEVAKAGVGEQFALFEGGMQYAVKHFGIGTGINARVVNCPRSNSAVEVIKLVDGIPAMNFPAQYGIYITKSYLKSEDEDMLPRVAINRVCRIQQQSLEPADANEESLANLKAEKCMAEMLHDTKALEWIDRQLPHPTEEESHDEHDEEIDRLLQQKLEEMQHLIPH